MAARSGKRGLEPGLKDHDGILRRAAGQLRSTANSSFPYFLRKQVRSLRQPRLVQAVAGDGAERITLEAAMAKAYATEAAQRIVDDAVQILGGKGVLADSVVDHLYRAVRALRIYEGTTEIQHLVIAGQVLKRYREKGSA